MGRRRGGRWGGSQEFDEIVANEEKPEWNRGEWEVGGGGKKLNKSSQMAARIPLLNNLYCKTIFNCFLN